MKEVDVAVSLARLAVIPREGVESYQIQLLKDQSKRIGDPERGS